MGVLFWFFRVFFGTLRRAGWTLVLVAAIVTIVDPHFVGNLIGLGLHRAGNAVGIAANGAIDKGRLGIEWIFFLLIVWFFFFGARGRGRNNNNRRRGDRR